MTHKYAITYGLKSTVPNPPLPFYNVDTGPEKSSLHPILRLHWKETGVVGGAGPGSLDELSKKFSSGVVENHPHNHIKEC